jgi:hypothetical protein
MLKYNILTARIICLGIGMQAVIRTTGVRFPTSFRLDLALTASYPTSTVGPMD